MIKPTIFENSERLHIAAAEFWIKACAAAIGEHGSFHVALSGGTTPKHLFQLLAKSPFKEQVA